MTALEAYELDEANIEQTGEIFEIDFQNVPMHADTSTLGEMSTVICAATVILMC